MMNGRIDGIWKDKNDTITFAPNMSYTPSYSALFYMTRYQGAHVPTHVWGLWPGNFTFVPLKDFPL